MLTAGRTCHEDPRPTTPSGYALGRDVPRQVWPVSSWLTVAERRSRVGLSRRVSVVPRHVGQVVVPRLCAFHENVGIRLEPARVVQSADAESDEVRASPDLHVQRRAAITAEKADDVVAAVGFRDIALWCALEDAEPRTREAGGGDVRGTALALAVAAMATQGEDGFAQRFVADCAAEAAACLSIGFQWGPCIGVQ
jgi:hypothetical protein